MGFISSFIYIYLIPLPTQAFSLNNLYQKISQAIGIPAQKKDNVADLSEENIQYLKVLEPDKNLKAISTDKNLPIKIIDENDITLATDKENFYVGESLEQDKANIHSDNAIYKVQKGESLRSIADYFSISPETILSLNKITEKDVRPGVILEIPSIDGINYEIKKGDTLGKLAEKYKINLDDILLWNGFLPNQELAIGEEIFLPGVKPERKVEKKPQPKNIPIQNANLAQKSNPGFIDPVLGNLSKYIRNLGRGSTAQNNKLSNVRKYASLPKYPGYYTLPAPGTNRTQTLHGHNGADFAGPIGTPVVAAAEGTVRIAKNFGYNFGYGNYIIISHLNGSETVYAHLSTVLVSPGSQVEKGQAIGAIGSTGNSTGPHLHFEIRGAYNPWAW